MPPDPFAGHPFRDATLPSMLDAETVLMTHPAVAQAFVPRTPGPHGDKVQKDRLREQALQALGLAGASR
jgi:hypothetical protein